MIVYGVCLNPLTFTGMSWWQWYCRLDGWMDEWMDKMITMSPFGNEDDYVLLGWVIPPKTVIISRIIHNMTPRLYIIISSLWKYKKFTLIMSVAACDFCLCEYFVDIFVFDFHSHVSYLFCFLFCLFFGRWCCLSFWVIMSPWLCCSCCLLSFRHAH